MLPFTPYAKLLKRTDSRQWLHLLHQRLQAAAAGALGFAVVLAEGFDTLSLGARQDSGSLDPLLVVSVAGGFLLTMTVLGEICAQDNCHPADPEGLARFEEQAVALVALAHAEHAGLA